MGKVLKFPYITTNQCQSCGKDIEVNDYGIDKNSVLLENYFRHKEIICLDCFAWSGGEMIKLTSNCWIKGVFHEN